MESSVIEVRALGMSSQGRVRKNNEDSLATCDLSTGDLHLGPFECRYQLGPRGALLLIADGMGGEACGELASQMCAEEVPRQLLEGLEAVEKLDEAAFGLSLRHAVELANDLIFRRAQGDPAHHGMGTTATAAALFGTSLFVAQVGDSRAYLIRERRMVPLTRDQTFLNYLAEIGAEPPADPENDPRKSILIQAVGTSETLDVKLTGARMCRGDLLLLCSDGLYNMVKAPDLLSVVNRADSISNRCQALLEMANANGGTDNITLILAQFTGAGLYPPAPSAAVEVKEFEPEDLKTNSQAG